MGIIEGARSDPGEGHSAGLIVTDVTISTVQVLTLNATEREVLAAPGADKAIILVGAMIHKPAGTAYAGIAAGEDLSISYTNAAGVEVARCETTGFLDSTAALSRWVHAFNAASGASQIVPAANAALVIHMLVGEVITGTSALIIRLYHRVVPTVLS